MELYDVAVIGGGVTGASAANHLAAAGFSIVLLERGDFAGGTSGRSSRLQYCGLSYFGPGRTLWSLLVHPRRTLEAMELARRAMRDRSAFIRNTPERLRPLQMFIPLHSDGAIPVWQARAGMALLERLDGGGVPLDYRLLSPAEAKRHPALSHLRAHDRLMGVMQFTEHQFNWPERICLDTVLHARDAGASVHNYTRVDSLERRGSDGLWHINGTDLRSGQAFGLRAKAVINATGAWIDDLVRASRLPVPRLNQGAKGTNVVVRLPEAFRGLGFETVTRKGEPFYVIPWDDLHYFGPKDKAKDPTPENFRTEEDEVEELLAEMNHLLPSLKLTRRDVLYTWSGVRPRTYSPDAPIGSMATLLHDFGDRGLPGYYTYTGGLIMTHRHAGRALTRAVGKRLAPSRPSRPLALQARLFQRPHNTPAVGAAYPDVSLAELRHAAAEEQVGTLHDLMFRRVRLGWTAGMGHEVAREVAMEVRDILGWSPEEAERQAESYLDYLRQEFNLAV